MNGAAAFPMAAIPLPRLLHPEVSVRPPVIGTGIPAKAAVFLHSPLTPLPLATTDGAGMTVTVAANLPRVVPMSSGTPRGRAAYPTEAPTLPLLQEGIALITVGTGIPVKAVAFRDNRRTHLPAATITGIGIITTNAARPRHPNHLVTITTGVLPYLAAHRSALRGWKLAPSQVWFKAATTSVSIPPPSWNLAVDVFHSDKARTAPQLKVSGISDVKRELA
jgi:hypothetical protein